MKVNFQTQKIVKLNSNKNNTKNFSGIKFKNNKVCFLKNGIVFKGQTYSKKDIELAKKYLNNKDDSWKEELYKEEYKDKKKNGYIDWEIPAHNGSAGGHLDLNEPANRIMLDILTFGLTEIPVQITYSGYRKESRRHGDEINLIVTDLKNAKINEEIAENNKIQEEKQRELKYFELVTNVKNNELYPKLLNKIQARKEGKKVEVPNCVMLSNESDTINHNLINWSLSQANCNVDEVDLWEDGFDLVDFLEKAEENYQKTKEWNLIYAKNMDKLINPDEVEPAVIAAMKDIMCSTADEFHTTLIFSATCPEELDDTAIETNRVTRINTDKLLSIEELKKKDIEKKSQDKDYVETSPLSAINDLVDYVNIGEKYKLHFNSTETDIEQTLSEIQQNMTSYQKKQFELVLSGAKAHAWYCTGNMPSKEDKKQQCTKETRGLDNVIGMKALKQTLYNEVIEPINNPEKYNNYGIKGAINGFLLYGPPGCGKTFIIENLAEEMGRYCVKITPSNVGSSYIHQTAKNINDKFQEAESHAPSIVFIDEIEAIAPRREGLDGSGAAEETNEQVTELLTQMNNCSKKDVLVVCASNEPQRIDAAIKRTGRLDLKIFVPNPDFESRQALIEKQLEKIKMKDEIDIDLIAQKTEYYTAKDIEMLIRKASIKAMSKDKNITTNEILDAIKEYQPDLSKEKIDLYELKGKI